MVFDGASSSLSANYVAPIVLDLDGDGAEFSSIANNSVLFDVDDDGELEKTAWAGRDDALLVYDYDDDGDITKTDEISFTGYLEGAKTDLEGLFAFDSNDDEVLNEKDIEWSKFKSWQDADQDGDVDEGELFSLSDLGIIEIELNSDQEYYETEDVKVFGETSFVMEDGSVGVAADSAFRYEEQEVEFSLNESTVSELLDSYGSDEGEQVMGTYGDYSYGEDKISTSELHDDNQDIIDSVASIAEITN